MAPRPERSSTVFPAVPRRPEVVLLAIGAEHILFATDYPFEELSLATEFLRTAPISEADRAKIAHENTEKLLHLEKL
jgi:predicted TIM-barrel fold metal-dependent hydrolase